MRRSPREPNMPDLHSDSPPHGESIHSIPLPTLRRNLTKNTQNLKFVAPIPGQNELGPQQYSPGEKLCKRMTELSPVKMKALPGPDAENICCHLHWVLSRCHIWRDFWRCNRRSYSSKYLHHEANTVIFICSDMGATNLYSKCPSILRS